MTWSVIKNSAVKNIGFDKIGCYTNQAWCHFMSNTILNLKISLKFDINSIHDFFL